MKTMNKKKFIIVLVAAALAVATSIGIVIYVKTPKLDKSFKGIVVGFSDVSLTEAPYKLGETVYADIREYGDYLSAVTSVTEDGKVAIVSVDGKIYAFELDKTEVSITDIETEEKTTATISVAPKATNTGMDIAVKDFSELLGYTVTEENHTMFVK